MVSCIWLAFLCQSFKCHLLVATFATARAEFLLPLLLFNVVLELLFTAFKMFTEVAGVEGLGMFATAWNFFLTSETHGFRLIFSIDHKKNDQIVLLFFRSCQSLPEASSTVDIASYHAMRTCMYIGTVTWRLYEPITILTIMANFSPIPILVSVSVQH